MDLVDCDDISESAILKELETRYRKDEIYSSIGPILIAVNPFRLIKDLYGAEVRTDFVNGAIHTGLIREIAASKPHVWMVAKAAYAQLLNDKCAQAIVISGESGAGKTEATKQCLQLLSSIAAVWSGKTQDIAIEDKVLATNPVLESFGNSKTARNNNSSRFGKWIQLNYAATTKNNNGIKLIGAKITQYLLEKSRVVVHSSEERNYHIFYQLCANGVLDLQPAANYRCLRFARSLQVPGVDDRRNFQETLQSMDDLGFTEEDKDTIFSCLKAILLLGNVVFQEQAPTNNIGYKASVIGREFQPLVHNVSSMFSLAEEELSRGLTGRTMTLRGETTRIEFDIAQAQNAVNAFCKEVYGRLFNFIVYQANKSLQAQEFKSLSLTEEPPNVALSIGVLDIFGFEKFKFNSFEQLCINYANEKLHQYFISYVLKREQELYESEGIESSFVIPIDNTDVLELIEAKSKGMFARLDDEIKLPKSSDETFLKKVENDHNNKANSNRRFVKEVKMSATQFDICHFAGQIRYDSTGFLEKNRDKLFEHLEILLASSQHDRFRELMTTDWSSLDKVEEEDRLASSSKHASTTIATRFQLQLQSLMDVLNQSQPHFIKCIKPNNTKEPAVFEEELVLQQLRYSGVLEAIQVRKSGYPTRRSHRAFWKAFWMIPPRTDRRSLLTLADDRKCEFIIDRLKDASLEWGDIKLGKTFVFLRSNTTKLLEDEKERRKHPVALFTQSHFRRRANVLVYIQMCDARDGLRSVVLAGKQNKASNLAVIPDLASAIKVAKDNSLPTKWVNEAEVLLERLAGIKACLDKLSFFTTNQNETQNRDVVEEYQDLKVLVTTAQELDIESPILVTVSKRLLILQERAECVIQLRKATQEGDEFLLSDCLLIAKNLISSHGEFCMNDIVLAQKKLSTINNDHLSLEQQVQAIAELLHNFESNTEGNQPISHHLVAKYFTDADLILDKHLEVWEINPPSSPKIDLILRMQKELKSLHSFWAAESWDNTLEIVQHLTNDTLITLRRSGDRYFSSHQYITQAIDIVLKDIQIAQHDIHSNVIMPKVLHALTIAGASLKMNSAERHVEALPNLIEELRGYLWLGDSCDTLLSCLDKLQHIYDYSQEGKWEHVLACAETFEAYEKYMNVRSDWLDSVKNSMNISEDSIAELDAYSNITLENEILDNVYELDLDYNQIRDEILKQVDLFKADSLDQLILKALRQIIMIKIRDENAQDTENSAELVDVYNCLISTLHFSKTVRCMPSLSNQDQGIVQVCIELIESATVLFKAIIDKQYQASLDMLIHDSCLILKSSDKFELSVQDFNLRSLQKLQIYCFRWIYSSLQAIYIPVLVAEIKSKPYCLSQSILGNVEERNKVRHDHEGFRNLIITFQNTNKSILSRVKMSESAFLTSLYTVSEAVLGTRVLFMDPLEDSTSYERLRIALENLQVLVNKSSLLLESSLAVALNNEMSIMSLALKINHRIAVMSSVLAKAEGTISSYLIPVSPGGTSSLKVKAKRPTSVNLSSTVMSPQHASPAGTRVKSLSFHDLSPAIQSNITFEDFLLEDGYVLNDAMLSVNSLNEQLEESHELLSILEEEDDQIAVSVLQEYVTAIEQLRDIRSAVNDEEWSRAYKISIQLLQSEISHKVTAIRAELIANESFLQNYAVISLCYQALTKGVPAGAIGQVDYKAISLSLLEEAIDLCQSVGCHSERAKALFNAVLIIADLRKAQKVGDWTEIKLVVTRAENSKIGEGLSSICHGEIVKATIERENHEATQLLKTALVNEEMFTKEGKLDVEQISTKELSSVMNRLFIIQEESRGSILKCLHLLADSLLKTRKCTVQGQWQIVESLLPVIKENIETFQNELEMKERQPLGRKTLSLRTTSVRAGSIMPGPVAGRDKQKSIMPGDNSVVRSASWEEFAELTQSVKREIKAIEHHFAVIELEIDLNKSLSQHGAQLNESGTIDRCTIQMDELQEVLERASNLDASNLSLPKHLKALRKVGMLILDIRTAIVKDQWDTMSSLLEETLSGEINVWPEYSKLEIQAVRREVENRWIVSNLTSALLTGRLEGDIGATDFGKISYSHLLSYIETAKSLNSRTEISLILLRTAEIMYALREIVVKAKAFSEDAEKSREVSWSHVRKMAKEVQEGIIAQHYHSLIQSEVRVILDTAENEMTCDMLVQALRVGGVSGEPGLLNLVSVMTKDLEKVYGIAVRSTIKTELAKSLLTASRIVQKLREAIIRAEVAADPFSGVAIEAWRTVEALLREIPVLAEEEKIGRYTAEMSLQERAMRISWSICTAEIQLIRRHFWVEELKRSVIQSCTAASHLYYERNQYKSSKELSMENIHSEQLIELVEELEVILLRTNTLDFECDYLIKYKSCAATLLQLRKALNEKRFEELQIIIAQQELRNSVSILTEAKQEFAWIMCEYNNNAAISLLCNTLKAVCEKDAESQNVENNTTKVIKAESFMSKTVKLANALESVKQYRISSEIGKQWLECCDNMFILRRNLENRQHAQVNKALRWFRNNAKTSPNYVKLEAQRAYIIYQNDLMVQGLTSALGEGKCVGKIGEASLENIETARLGSLIQQTKDIRPIFPETLELVEAADIALKIRIGLKDKDMHSLQELMDNLSGQESFNLLIIDEIATARAEVDNSIAVQALEEALRSFEDAETNAFDISFLQDANHSNVKSVSNLDPSSSNISPNKKAAGFSILESMAERRYSFANKNSVNIDPETIDITALETGLRVALDHGVYSARAIRLFKTVELVKSLRVAMKSADWPRVQETLDEAKYEQEVGVKYDLIASKEILAVRSQLEIRAAIVDLSKALRIGWAKCSQGIVDTSDMQNERLSDAIDCADRCIMELSIQISSSDKEALTYEEKKAILDSSPVHKKVQLLMDSAKLVLRIREVLAMGNMEQAGTLADEALSQPLHYSVVEELRLYAKEINIALSSMNMSETLRAHANAGKIAPLGQAISDALKIEGQHSNDLGIVRVLDCAERRYQQLLEMRKHLQRSLDQVYDVAEIQDIVDKAVAFNYSDSELHRCVEKINKLNKLNSILADFESVWTSMPNEKMFMKRVIDEAEALQLTKHPRCLLLKLLSRVSAGTLRGIKLHDAWLKGNVYAICTETIRMKRAYLELPTSMSKYKLENFPKLRKPEDFAQRMTIVSEELAKTMLLHSDQPLPTSLTLLSAHFSAIAVLIFTDCVRGLEKNIYSYPAIAVKQVFELGCTCVTLRDEILLQIVKQIRNNTESSSLRRMWKLLCACLYYFPPSQEFESFLETFFLQSQLDNADTTVVCHAQRATRFMHRSILLYGQSLKVKPKFCSEKDCLLWMEEEMYVPIEVQVFGYKFNEKLTESYQKQPWEEVVRRYITPTQPPEMSVDLCTQVKQQRQADIDHYVEVFGVLDLSDPAFTDAGKLSTTSSTASSLLPPTAPSLEGKGTTAVSVKPVTASNPIPNVHRIRGSREDWSHRFRLIIGPKESRELLSKSTFCQQLCAAFNGKAEMDRMDKQLLFFLLFNKRILDIAGVLREYSADEQLFHFSSEDESASSAQRRAWLFQHITTTLLAHSLQAPDPSSELFFSQLQAAEVGGLAERFWENVVERMARDCKQYPFLALTHEVEESGASASALPLRGASLRPPGSTKRAEKGVGQVKPSDTLLSGEVYRELLLVGMQIALLKYRAQQTVG